MKKWEANNLQKAHIRKLQNAKPAIRTSLKYPGTPKPNSAVQSGNISKFLSDYSLTQYQKVKIIQKLADLKMDNSWALMELTPTNFEDLMSNLHVLPGHANKFKKMIETMQNSSFPEPSKIISRTSSHISTATTNKRRKNSSNSTNVLSQTDIHSHEKNKLIKELEIAKRTIEELELQLYKKNNQPIQLQKKLPVEMSRDSFFETPLAFEECKKPQLFDENLGKSLDSFKMRSTLINLDLEELCRCFARAIICHIENSPILGSRLLGVRNRLAEQFIEEGPKPDEISIYNYIKNLVVRGQMEYEVPIVSLVYLERIVAKSGIRVNSNNWKKLVFITFIEASKV